MPRFGKSIRQVGPLQSRAWPGTFSQAGQTWQVLAPYKQKMCVFCCDLPWHHTREEPWLGRVREAVTLNYGMFHSFASSRIRRGGQVM